jgi:hypothetical protein
MSLTELREVLALRGYNWANFNFKFHLHAADHPKAVHYIFLLYISFFLSPYLFVKKVFFNIISYIIKKNQENATD